MPSPPVPDHSNIAAAPPRDVGFDVLRGCVALLVIAHHAALTYGGDGDWFYREVPPSGSASSHILTLFCALNQAWFMGLFFLLAGYYTPAAMARRGAIGLARERLLKLGVPLLVFGYGLGPFTVALARTAKGAPFWPTLFHLWRHATFVLGPPWFCWALLLLTAAFLVSRYSPSIRPLSAFPLNAALLLAALLTGLAAFALRLVWPVGAISAGLQLGYAASYVVLFGAGCLASAGHHLGRVPKRAVWLWGSIALLACPTLPLVVLLGAKVPTLAGSIVGGWSVPALSYAFWEPLVAWGIILALLRLFARRFERPNPFARALGRRAYAIFILHPPVLVGTALLLRPVVAAPLVKAGLATILSCALTYLVAGLALRERHLARVL